MRKSLFVFAVGILALACASGTRAQSGTYTQFYAVGGRSGELNFFGVELKDSSGTLRGNYSLECNSNAINNSTCHFTLVLDSVTYYGKVTQVTIYFPVNDADKDDSGPFAYNWSATANGVTLTGSSEGNGHWAYSHGYYPIIEAGTTVTVN